MALYNIFISVCMVAKSDKIKTITIKGLHDFKEKNHFISYYTLEYFALCTIKKETRLAIIAFSSIIYTPVMISYTLFIFKCEIINKILNLQLFPWNIYLNLAPANIITMCRLYCLTSALFIIFWNEYIWILGNITPLFELQLLQWQGKSKSYNRFVGIN